MEVRHAGGIDFDRGKGMTRQDGERGIGRGVKEGAFAGGQGP